MAADPRILGSAEFVEEELQEARPRLSTETRRRRHAREAAAALHAACEREGCTPEELRAGSRRWHISLLRAKLARHLVTNLGLSLAETARHLGVSTSAISRIVRKSERR